MRVRCLGVSWMLGLSVALCLAACGSSPGEGSGAGGSLDSSAGGSGGDGTVEVQLGTEFSVQCRNYQPAEDCRGAVEFVTCAFQSGRVSIDIGTACTLFIAVAGRQGVGLFSSAESSASVTSICSGGVSRKDEAPCTIEVEQLVRGEPMSSGGSQSVELGSSVTMKVSCPEGLVHDGGDDVGFVRKRLSPSTYRVTATDCELLP